MREIVFPLPRDNQITIKLAKPVTVEEFALILKIVEFVKYGLIENLIFNGFPDDPLPGEQARQERGG